MLNPLQLEQFGLNEKEARVYLAALQLGVSGVQNIAEIAEIHRVSTYDLLESLKEKGFVKAVSKNGKKLIAAIEPEEIKELIRAKERLFETLLPELKAVQAKEAKPKILYYEGAEAVWRVYRNRLNFQSAPNEILIYGRPDHPRGEFENKYKAIETERLKKGIEEKIIAEKNDRPQPAAVSDLTQTKFTLPGKNFSGQIFIYGDKLMTIYWDSLIAVIIEDRRLAENQRFIFKLLWESLN